MDESRPHLRASDADRESVAGQLREHTTLGRLTVSELDERLGEVYAARTHGELLALLRDLPPLEHPLPVPPTVIAPTPVPVPVPAASAHPPARINPTLATWISLSLLLVVIWVLTVLPDFWPKWPIGIAGAVAAGGWIRRQGGHQHGPHGGWPGHHHRGWGRD
jgi:hypothetical protein